MQNTVVVVGVVNGHVKTGDCEVILPILEESIGGADGTDDESFVVIGGEGVLQCRGEGLRVPGHA